MSGPERCPDCGVTPGEQHDGGCDVARCKVCGWQAIGCADHPDAEATVWTGEWPGVMECREMGLWARWTVVSKHRTDGVPDTGPCVPCDPDHPHAREDLNRMIGMFAQGLLVWDSEGERWRRAT